MSLSYFEMYNAAAGIYMTFSNTSKNKKRLLTVKHTENKRQKMKSVFPVNKYKLWTKENFIIACLYVNFKKSPSSLYKAIEFLDEIEDSEVHKFKNEILYYKKYVKEDMDHVLITEGTGVSTDFMIKEYRNNNIQWYTLHFFLLAKNESLDDYLSSRVNAKLIRSIKNLLLYITFSDKSVQNMKSLLRSTVEI
jgi:Fe2+ or Zn2+ uptake regulation protein